MSRLLLVLLVVAAANSVAAHDMWIEPSRFQPPADTVVEVRLRVGDGPEAAVAVRRDPHRIERFVVSDGEAPAPIPGLDGHDPAGWLRFPGPGLYVLGYRSRPARLELTAEKFEAYLEEEGLEHVLRLRDERGERRRPGVERYSRCLKSLVAVGEPGPVDGDRALGFPLELIAETNPYQLDADDVLTLRLLYDGRPLAGARVRAVAFEGGGERLVTRTDEAGRASFPSARPGAWLITAVHMVEAGEESGVEWESFWASLTFNSHRN